MNPREQGFLLLSSHLGNEHRKPLTQPQLRVLAQRMQNAAQSPDDRSLQPRDLMQLGYGRAMAERIVSLLSDDALLNYYVKQARRHGCMPITRVSEGYPRLIRQRLGLDSPGCLWAKGDISILNTPAVALVGSRELRPENRIFAEEVGRQAGRLGMTLVSGNARGADRAAQNACLDAGGSVISIVADELSAQPVQERILYLSEDCYDAPFTPQRALSRNRCIHALGQVVFVAQADYGKGGTWDGTVKNLRFGWSNVACFRDGSKAMQELEQMGAYLLTLQDLADFDFSPGEEYRLI